MQVYVTTVQPHDGDCRVIGVRTTLAEAKDLAVCHFLDECHRQGLLSTAMFQGNLWAEEDGRWVDTVLRRYAVSEEAVPPTPRDKEAPPRRLRRAPRRSVN